MFSRLSHYIIVKYYLAISIALFFLTASEAQTIKPVLIDSIHNNYVPMKFSNLNEVIYHYIEHLDVNLDIVFIKVYIYPPEINSQYFNVNSLINRIEEFETAIELKHERFRLYSKSQFDELRRRNNPDLEDEKNNEKLETLRRRLKLVEEEYMKGDIDISRYEKQYGNISQEISTLERGRNIDIPKLKETEDAVFLYVKVYDYDYDERTNRVGIRIKIFNSNKDRVMSVENTPLTRTFIVSNPTTTVHNPQKFKTLSLLSQPKKER